MSLSNGTRLGPYEIVSRVGAGGMGEVFRARDTRLDRTVAVKVLPAELAQNTRLRLRFQREARAISALSHPNICTLYDVGEHDGVDFLVMEYLEGETLADRLLRGPVPLKEALRHAIDIAAALERAHRDGVVHRDLKPGNVMLTRGGAKLLDFGLARSTALEAATPFDATQQKPLTAEGTIVGTFQYMAPEQLDGQQVDHRTDIFAFGALLYEMLTGTRAFTGKTRTSLIAAIVAGTPRPITETQPVTPPELEHVVQRCLEKEPDARWQSAHDVKLELEWIAHRADVAAPPSRRARLPWIVAAVALAAAVAAGVFAWRTSRATPLPTAIRAQIAPPRGRHVIQSDTYLSISPDGRHMTFGTDDDERIWLRPLGTNESRPIEGTTFGGLPFWSPDSRWIAFFAEGKLKKVALDGSPPVVICDAPLGRSGTWSRDGVILFSPTPRSGIHRVPAEGGTPVPVTRLDQARKETTHRWPVFLPDGNHFYYLAGAHDEVLGHSRNAVYLASLDAPQSRTPLLRASSNVVYSAGHLIFVRDGLLVAQRFDARRRTLSGEPFRIGGAPLYNHGYFRAAVAAADDGTLVYTPAAAADDFRLSWWEAGSEKEALRPKVLLEQFSLSPDGRNVAAIADDPQTGLGDIWLFDLARGTSRRVTATPNVREEHVTWSRDARSILFTRKRGPDYEAVMLDLAGGTERVIFSDTKRPPTVTDVSPDGAWALATLWDERSEHTEAWLLPLRAGAAARRFVPELGVAAGTFSPDGQWVIYASNPMGRSQLRIARFPGGDHQTQLDTEYAWKARWINDAEVLISGPRGLRILPLTREGNGWIAGAIREPRPKHPDHVTTETLDGKRFLDLLQDPTAESQSTMLVTGWAPVRSP